MFRFVWQQVRGRLGRSVALLAGVLVATTGFVVLTGSANTSRLQVTGAVQSGTRAAYDILVRPRGSRTSLEAANGLVRPNYLSGQFGGVTLDDWAKVRSVPGIAVAAPIAMVGYSTIGIPAPFDLTDAVDRAAETQLIRVDPTFVAERGLSQGEDTPFFVYVTRRALIYPKPPEGIFRDTDLIRYSDGNSYAANDCGSTLLPVREVMTGGRSAPICEIPSQAPKGSAAPISDPNRSSRVLAVQMLPDGRFDSRQDEILRYNGPEERLRVGIRWEVPFLLAAVDPHAEDQLVGLNAATVRGRTLHPDDMPARADNPAEGQRFPVLASSRAYVDGTVRASYTRLRPSDVSGLRFSELTKAIASAPATPAGGGETDVDPNYRGQMESIVDQHLSGGFLVTLVQPGTTHYETLADGTLRATTQPGDQQIFDTPQVVGLPRPWLTADDWFRPLTKQVLMNDPTGNWQTWSPVGMFDPQLLTGFSDLGRVPLETYEAPAAQGADAASRTALGDRSLLPSGNPAGYLTPPPLLLTSMSVLPDLLTGQAAGQAEAPISAIRVRVAGVDGYSRDSAERVRVAAEEIERRTGLDVDITLGSSQAPRSVELPAGAFGRPVLHVTERWSSIGVASRIVDAVDRKSVVLFVLVLVVCALFLGNAVSAAVRDRRTELAVLTCLGWPPGRLAAALIGEVALLGLLAGLASVGLAWPLGRLLGVHVSAGHALLAVPVALLLAVGASVLPVVRAARAHPAAALRPPAGRPGRRRQARSMLRLSWVNLTRVPGRTALGAIALAIGVASVTVLAAVTFAFQGVVIGTVLGDAVAVTVRGVDQLAAAAAVLLGVVAVADVLYLNIRDRAGELAALRATGWSDLALVRLIAVEGLLLGVLGAIVGASAGLAVAAWLVGAVSGPLIIVAAASAAAGLLITGAAAVVPTLLLRRLPAARLLAEE